MESVMQFAAATDSLASSIINRQLEQSLASCWAHLAFEAVVAVQKCRRSNKRLATLLAMKLWQCHLKELRCPLSKGTQDGPD